MSFIKGKTYRIVIITAVVALAGLLITQIYWFYQAYNLEEKQFDEKVNLALRSVSDELLKADKKHDDRILPIRKTTSNTFHVNLNEPIEYLLLDSLVRKTFIKFKISAPFQLRLYDENLTTLLLGNFYKDGALSTDVPTCIERDQAAFNMDFVITFPEKKAHILNELGIWIFTAFTFLVILSMFSYMIVDLSKKKKLSEMKADFVNNMTHELQTPITNISIASEVLRKGNSLDATKSLKYVEIIFRENQRLKQQVEQVLRVAVMEKGELELKKKALNINHLLEEVVDNFQLRVLNREGKLLKNLKAAQPIILGDELHITNMFYSLLDNADKYSISRPEITVTSSNNKEGLLIGIADRGIGIGRDVQKYIFEKFYRAPTGDLHDVKGFGLGLTYVKMIVQAHSGSIMVSSEQNKGSFFEIFLKQS